MKNRKKKSRIGAALTGIPAAFLLIAGMMCGCGRTEKGNVDTAPGIAYIEELETESVDEVKQTLKDIHAAELEAECQERISILENDQSQAWRMLDDYLFMGDSRCVSWVYYGFMTEEQCVAEKGINIDSHLEKNIDVIAAKNPAYLYLAYGVNDISCGLWHTGPDYAAEYGRILDEIHAVVPDTKIYVNSILPTTEGAWERCASFMYCEEWNEDLEAMCDERDYCYYVENTGLCEKYSGMYLDDGIHFEKEFYPHWMAHILITQYEYELQEKLDKVDETGSDAETVRVETEPHEEKVLTMRNVYTGGRNS